MNTIFQIKIPFILCSQNGCRASIVLYTVNLNSLTIHLTIVWVNINDNTANIRHIFILIKVIHLFLNVKITQPIVFYGSLLLEEKRNNNIIKTIYGEN